MVKNQLNELYSKLEDWAISMKLDQTTNKTTLSKLENVLAGFKEAIENYDKESIVLLNESIEQNKTILELTKDNIKLKRHIEILKVKKVTKWDKSKH